MCGRVTLTLDKQMVLDILADVFEVANTPAISHVPNYNIGPSSNMLSIIETNTRPKSRRAGHLKWGFVPPWTEEDSINYSLFNSRSETVMEKQTFKASFKQKRCILLADSFYEWTRTKDKRAYRFQTKDQILFPLAGIYTSLEKRDGTKLHTCSVLTCEPNEIMEPIHHRMPVILTPETSKIWLGKSSQEEELLDLLKPYSADLMTVYQVSDFVNSVKNNSPKCIEPIGEQQSFL